MIYDCGLMIEKQQKRISHTSTISQSYPSEMSFAMVKSAAPWLNPLRCDCHQFNLAGCDCHQFNLAGCDCHQFNLAGCH